MFFAEEKWIKKEGKNEEKNRKSKVKTHGEQINIRTE